MSSLIDKNCIPCKGGIPPFTEDQTRSHLELVDGWNVVDNHHIEKTIKFPDFKSALAFVNQVGELAEQENHHPNINFTWGKVEISTWTHKINGLHENDFILAAKIDALLQ